MFGFCLVCTFKPEERLDEMRNGVALRSATAVAIAGMFFAGGGGSAFAQTTETPTSAPAVAAGNIDFQQTGSITLHKYLNPTTPGTPESDGTELSDVTGTALAGVTFQIQRVNLDLSDPAQFAEASKLDVAGAKTKLDPAVVFTKATDAQGIASFEDLPLGIYVVTETEVPEGSSIKKSADFLVSVPMTNPDGAGWNYNVHAYPKNYEGEATKTVTDADKNVGDSIVYHISTPIFPPDNPDADAPDGGLANYWIADKLDAERLDFTDMPVTVQVKSADGAVVELSVGTDYEQIGPNADGVVNWIFTETGRGKLAQHPNENVEVTLSPKVKAIGDTDGVTENKAFYLTNDPTYGYDPHDKPWSPGDNPPPDTPPGETPPPPTGETPEVKTYHGKLKLEKYEEGGTAASNPLAGATFELYRCAGTETDPTQLTDKVTIADKGSWTTDTQGEIVIDGLHVTDWEDSKTAIDKSYCLIETQAPAGYVKNDSVIPFKLTRDDKTADVEYIQAVKQVANTRSTVPQLPLTGGAGIGLVAVVGLLLLGGASYMGRGAKKA